LGKKEEARAQYAQTIAGIQEEARCDYALLIHCHGRLIELAEDADDDYQVHLHRGIGLYWLAQGCRVLGAEHAPMSPEGLLCKAAGELSLAQGLRPDEARPAWYLHAIWRNL